jgi:pimeloyl-ACP methyl ester carboxylesterase
MPHVQANGLRLAYEVSGDPAAPPVLLVMGLGAQLTRWPEPFHRALSDAGYYVIRFDNRDVGLSTHLDQLGRPALGAAAVRAAFGLPVQAPYLLSDLAADAVGLLDALGIARAHIVGASMGGMIAQLLAAHHGDRVRTLVSIMSTSGDRRLPQPGWRLRMALIRRPRPGADRETLIASTTALLKLITSPGFPPDDAVLREQVASDIDRAYHPQGVGRQLLAILASGSRTSVLGQIRAPSLILHGAEDPLVPVAAAHDQLRRIPGSRMEIFAGMGHDLPRALVPALTGHIIDHLRRADAASGASQGDGSAAS